MAIKAFGEVQQAEWSAGGQVRPSVLKWHWTGKLNEARGCIMCDIWHHTSASFHSTSFYILLWHAFVQEATIERSRRLKGVQEYKKEEEMMAMVRKGNLSFLLGMWSLLCGFWVWAHTSWPSAPREVEEKLPGERLIVLPYLSQSLGAEQAALEKEKRAKLGLNRSRGPIILWLFIPLSS